MIKIGIYCARVGEWMQVRLVQKPDGGCLVRGRLLDGCALVAQDSRIHAFEEASSVSVVRFCTNPVVVDRLVRIELDTPSSQHRHLFC